MAEQRASILYGVGKPEDRGLSLIKELPTNLQRTVDILNFAPRFTSNQRFGEVPGSKIHGYAPQELHHVLGGLVSRMSEQADFSTNEEVRKDFLRDYRVPDFDTLSLAVLDATKYLSGENARTTGSYYWKKAEDLRTSLSRRYSEKKRSPRVLTPARAAVALSSFALAVEGCATVGPKPIATELPGSNVVEVAQNFDIEAQKVAALSVMRPWEGKMLNDGFTLSSPIENGTPQFISAPELMLHQTNETGEQMPGMVTLAWISAENASTQQTGRESFLFFTDENGIPKQAALLEFQESTLVNQLSANLLDVNGNVIGHININHDLTNTEQPFANIQYTQATAVPGNPEAKLLNVVDLTFGSSSTIDDKEQFWNALIAFTTGAEPVFAASGDVISVTPTPELSTPAPPPPEVIPIEEAELNAIIAKVNKEFIFDYTLTENSEGRYLITSKGGDFLDNIYLDKDGKFYVTRADKSLVILPPDVVFMPNGTYVYAGFDRIAIDSGEVSTIPIGGWPTKDNINQLPRMTESMLVQYRQWVYEQLVDTGKVKGDLARANTAIRWDIMQFVSYGRVFSVQSLLPKGAKTAIPVKYDNLHGDHELPLQSYLHFVTLIDHPGILVYPIFIKNVPDTGEEFSLFPGVIDSDILTKEDSKNFLGNNLGLRFDSNQNEALTIMTIVYVIESNSTTDGLLGMSTLSMFKDGRNPIAQEERLKILTRGIETGSFAGSDSQLWPTGFWFVSPD